MFLEVLNTASNLFISIVSKTIAINHQTSVRLRRNCSGGFFLMEASQCAYKRNVILNNVRQDNYFITQGNYIGYMFRL